MAIALRSVGTPGANFTTAVLPKPAGVVVTDLLLAFLVNDSSSSNAPTAPAGWTEAFFGPTDVGKKCFYKFISGSEGSSFSFSTTAGNVLRGVILAYSGVDTSQPFDVAVAQALNSSSATTITTPTLTTATANTYIARVVMSNNEFASATSQFGENLDFCGTSNNNIAVLSSTKATAGSVGTSIITLPVSGLWRSTTLALRASVDPVPGAPDPVTSVQETHSSSVINLSWTNPATSDYAGVLIKRATGATPPPDTASGTLIGDVSTPGASISDSGLNPETTYSYALFAHDSNGNYASGVPKTITTSLPEGAPGPVSGVAYTVSSTGTSITWTEPNSPSYSGVMIRSADGDTPPATPNAGALAVDAAEGTTRFTKLDLQPATTYSFSLFAHDAYGNYASGVPLTFTSLAGVDPTPAASRPAVDPARGSNTLIDGVWVSDGPGLPKLRETLGRVKGPNILSRTPHAKGYITGITSMTSKVRHRFMFSGRDLVLVYDNFDQNNDTNSITVRAGIEVSGTDRIPVFFNGKRDVVIDPGGMVASDPIPLRMVENNTIWTRTRVTVNNGEKIPLGILYSLNGDSEGRDTTGDDLTTTGTIAAQFAANLYGPVSGYALSVENAMPCVALIGDSIMMTEIPTSSYVRRLSEAHIPHQQLARATEKASYFAGPNGRYRLRHASGCSHAIVEYTVNDLSTDTADQIKSNLLSIWRDLAWMGIEVLQTTCTPHTTSVDGWTSLAGQTVLASEADRLAINNWIRDGAPISTTTGNPVAIGTTTAFRAGDDVHPLSGRTAQGADGPGYFEIADTVESSRNSGKWALNVATTDGLHPGQSGQYLMETAIDTSVFSVQSAQ